MHDIDEHPRVFHGTEAFELPREIAQANRRARFSRQSETPGARVWHLDVYVHSADPKAFAVYHHTHDASLGLTIGWLEGWMSGGELRRRLWEIGQLEVTGGDIE